MGWETRGNVRYYYRKSRAGGRVVSEYVGAGPLGDLRAAFDAEDRQARALQRCQARREQAQDAQAARLLAELGAVVRQAVGAELRTAGYHQHRGQWRRQRMAQNDKAVTAKSEAARMVALAAAVDAGKAKPEQLAEFRAGLEGAPDLWRIFGNLAGNAERVMMKNAGLPAASREALTIGARRMRHELGYDTAPALERMIIEQAALSWMRLNIAECLAAEAMAANNSRTREHYDRLLSSAQHRHLRAVETLARVRRLLRPAAVQVNVARDGGQQVNMMKAE
jgi:hypothetical protein